MQYMAALPCGPSWPLLKALAKLSYKGKNTGHVVGPISINSDSSPGSLKGGEGLLWTQK